MKKILLLFLVMSTLAPSYAAPRRRPVKSAVVDTVSIVSGVWERGKPSDVKLYAVDNGRLKKIASAVPGESGAFSFAFTPTRAGFYVVGLNDVGAMQNYAFWFKPGDDLGLKVTSDSYVLTGGNTPENVEMTRWHNWVLPLEVQALYSTGKNITYEDFFPLLGRKLAEGYASAKSGDEAFDTAFEHYRKSYMATLAVNFLYTPRSKHPQPSDMTDYYRTLDIPALATSQLLGYPYMFALLRQFPMFYYSINKDRMPAEELQKFRDPDLSTEATASMFPSKEVGGEYVLERASSVKTYEGLLDFEERYSPLLANDAQRARLKKMINAMPIPKGAPAVDFRFPDVNGKDVALSDFKGKVVYIDVWATWCGPCRQQIPFLKKLEEEYHDNPDMVFMSVSTDADKDRQKWFDMVAAEKLGGVQLFGGTRSQAELMEPYKIKAIPRFILIGKDGSVINDDAPRPSSAEIRPLLKGALAR